MIILKQKKTQKDALPMPLDFEFVDSLYLEPEVFTTKEEDAREFVRFECTHGRFQE